MTCLKIMLTRASKPLGMPISLLEEMAKSYDVTYRTATVMFNHTISEVGNGRESLGYIESLEVQGDALLGTCVLNDKAIEMIKNVEAIAKSIEAEFIAFDPESMEVKDGLVISKKGSYVLGTPIDFQGEVLSVGTNMDREGNFRGPYLTGIAFLGDKQPAISDMPTLQEELEAGGVDKMENFTDYMKKSIKLEKEGRMPVSKRKTRLEDDQEENINKNSEDDGEDSTQNEDETENLKNSIREVLEEVLPEMMEKMSKKEEESESKEEEEDDEPLEKATKNEKTLENKISKMEASIKDLKSVLAAQGASNQIFGNLKKNKKGAWD